MDSKPTESIGVKEIARILDCSMQTIHNRRARADLPFALYQTGGRRVKAIRSDVEAYARELGLPTVTHEDNGQ